jgi:hypothetical protein
MLASKTPERGLAGPQHRRARLIFSVTSKQLQRWIRHPLTIAIVGFLLTGILGALFTQWLDSRAKRLEAEHVRQSRQLELEAAAHARAVEAVIELANLINERRTRAVLVGSAIYRHSTSKEIEARKWAYDDIYVRWNTKLDGLLLSIRDQIFRQVGNRDYETYIQALTHQMNLGKADNKWNAPWQVGYLTLMDDCVTDAFDAFEHQSNVNYESEAIAALDRCHFNEMNLKLLRCSGTMLESLYAVVNLGGKDAITKKIDSDSMPIKAACDPLSPDT